MGVLEQKNCATCPIGKEMRVGGGGFCPHLEEVRDAGEVVFKIGQRAESSWYLKEGAVNLVDGNGQSQEVTAPQTDLGASCIRNGCHGVSAVATSKIQLCRRPISWAPPWHDTKGEEEP